MLLLKPAGFLPAEAQEAGDIVRHPRLDLHEQFAMGGIERVVQIEDPGADMAEIGAVLEVGHGGKVGQAWAARKLALTICV